MLKNHYFDRVEEPGEMRVALLNLKKNNETSGGDEPGVGDIEDVFNVDKRSPKDGKIKIGLNAKKPSPVEVGDMCQVKVTLNGTGEVFDEIFWVKIADKEQPKETTPKEEKTNEENLGLPEFILAYHEPNEDQIGWETVESNLGETIDWETVMIPVASGDTLEKIIINMDSRVLKNYKSKFKNITEEQISVAERKYIASVYFHTLFLYTISKRQKYGMTQQVNGENKDVDLSNYLKDVFQSFYSEFILNFGGMEELMQGLED